MKIEQARERARSLNAQATLLKLDEKKKISTIIPLQNQKWIESAFLSAELFIKFEQVRLLKLFARLGDQESPRCLKALAQWAYVQKMIATVKLEPSHWAKEADPHAQSVGQVSMPEHR